MTVKPENTAWDEALETDLDGLETGWLAASWQDPDGLFSALMRVASQTTDTVPLKSVLHQGFDIYHDAVVRHMGSHRVALRWYHRERGWQTLTYEALHSRCARLAESWTEHGVGPGAIVGLVLPFGVEYVIALATGLCLGACVCPLSPVGLSYTITRRLVALSPTHVVSDMMHRGVLGDFEDMLLPAPASVLEDSREITAYRSYTYTSGETCALVYSPLRAESDVPIELSCDDAYLRGLRDGHLLFRLQAGDSLAAPGFAELQYQPSLLLATLLSGVTYVHVSMKTLEAEPALLMDVPLDTVGVTVTCRDLLMEARARGKPKWRQWFRNPEEGSDSGSWQDFVEAFSLEQLPVTNAIIESAAGGALLWSRASSGTQHVRALMNVRPAPAVPWMLLDASDSGQESVSLYGNFAHGADKLIASHVLISQFRGQEYIYTGTVEPRRDGWFYPRDEVIEALAGLSYVQAASVVAVPAGDGFRYRFVLLVFTGYHGAVAPDAAGMHEQEITQVLSHHVGKEFLPDRIQLFPLFAKMKGGAVDHDWCEVQYRRGMLYRKSRMPLFGHLTALRQVLLQSEGS